MRFGEELQHAVVGDVLVFVRQVETHVLGFHGRLAAQFVAERQVNPMVEVLRHSFALEHLKQQKRSRHHKLGDNSAVLLSHATLSCTPC